MSLCPLCTKVSQMNSLIAQTLSENQTLMDRSYTAEVMAIFVIFVTILAKIWLPWQRPLDPYNQKCLLWIGRPRKPLIISNRILVISCRNAFVCIYSNFIPKIGCHGNAPLSLVYESVTDEFPNSTNPISKPNSAPICCIQLKLWPFLWYLWSPYRIIFLPCGFFFLSFFLSFFPRLISAVADWMTAILPHMVWR